MTMLFSLFKRVIALSFLAVIVASLFIAIVLRDSFPELLHITGQSSLDTHNPPVQKVKSTIRIPCIGPRGTYVHQSIIDELQAADLNLSFPKPVGGSYETLGLPYTIHTPSTRYGEYGYEEGSDENNKNPVQWHLVSWAQLQNDCLAQNQGRFQDSMNVSTATKFSLINGAKHRFPHPEARTISTGRTAIVLRGWEGYNYSSIDMYHIRSLIVEAGLGSNADYAVFLLVDVKDKNNTRHIFRDTESYENALRDLVPDELRSITVLFDHNLLKTWYPRISDHSVFFQVYQPLQLFAQLFPGFDNYWQLEMDMKITGNSRLWLDALSRFAQNDPRKQSVERSSYFYMPQIHGSYQEFKTSINESLGGGGIWGPIRVPDIQHPIGPQPPVGSPQEDDFTWGVGEDADLILTNPLADVRTARFWPFMHWIGGFEKGEDTPRYYSPVAMGRYSWNLLNAMHYAQGSQGLSLPSEASALSFALYHGLKISFPPHPWFHHPQTQEDVSIEELETLFNGGTPAENAQTNNGLSFGKAMYDPAGVYNLFNGGTWWWVPGYPGRTMRQWMDQDRIKMPSMLREQGGQIWAPMMGLHPVKHRDLGI
ncbi:uncharacterized protein A1O9_04630 [Exophiala aquamarina CBS 119918]|uniref:Uncharacterized protein n=1 Tax=Exophiala aquamarina CBS 119918 TaxID=1182545 RepID=A0A072PJ95_9EURO|nr:uncharacterized protein A1O9_04630 [Exophiala aquamarina CBS 119918]KEF59782.1 hypothetical protein A1O9_04630 [Exophiala aquamarina CBS 119918]